jgi:hypothetical protein
MVQNWTKSKIAETTLKNEEQTIKNREPTLKILNHPQKCQTKAIQSHHIDLIFQFHTIFSLSPFNTSPIPMIHRSSCSFHLHALSTIHPHTQHTQPVFPVHTFNTLHLISLLSRVWKLIKTAALLLLLWWRRKFDYAMLCALRLYVFHSQRVVYIISRVVVAFFKW